MLLPVAALLLITICSNALAPIRMVRYTIPSSKINGRVRIALIADLHGSRYGRNQTQLMDTLAKNQPDVVLLCGDIFDSAARKKQAVAFINAVGATYPCCFVFGNHEHASGRMNAIRQAVTNAGITILEGDCLCFTANGQTIRIAGVDDAERNRRGCTEQLARVSIALAGAPEFSVLLAHQPQLISQLLDTRAGLILCGHTHGGQWSIPRLLNGLYAPGQGLFPKYAGGSYAFGAQTLIISRGLSKFPLWAPRLFTPRELVLVDIVQES